MQVGDSGATGSAPEAPAPIPGAASPESDLFGSDDLRDFVKRNAATVIGGVYVDFHVGPVGRSWSGYVEIQYSHGR